MAKKKEEIPVSVSTISKEDHAYITLAAKKIPYKIEISKGQILIPPDHFDIAKGDLNVMHIVGKFQFSIQSTIGAEYLPIKEDIIQFAGKKELVVIGLMFNNKAKAVFEVIDIDKYDTVTYINERESKNQISKNELLSKIKKGFYLIVRK